jgi:hypothetical protein
MAIFDPKDPQNPNSTFIVRPGTMGHVVAVHTNEVRLMSDVYGSQTTATVYHEAKGTFETQYVYCEISGPGHAYAEVDATEEIEKLYAAVQLGAQVTELRQQLGARVEQALKELTEIHHGAKVVVARGRKVPKGTAGEVSWTGQSTYGVRVGIRDAAGKVTFVDAKNVDVVVTEAQKEAARQAVLGTFLGRAQTAKIAALEAQQASVLKAA